MLFQSFLIKYGEIGIKGKNRYVFEEALMKQIVMLCSQWRAVFPYPESREEFM